MLRNKQLSIISSFRSLLLDFDKIDCGQIFNLYYALDPCSARMEPLLGPKFALLPPVNVPRFQRYPLGDGQQISFEKLVIELIIYYNSNMKL